MKEVAIHTFWVSWDGFFYGMFFLIGMTVLAKFAIWAEIVNLTQ